MYAERADDFNTHVREIAVANGVDPAKILEYIGRMGQEERAYEARIHEGNQRRQARRKTFAKIGLAGALGGIVLGSAAAAYQLATGALTNTIEARYHQKFYGPLDSLTTITEPPAAREKEAESTAPFFVNEALRNGSTFYDQTIGDVRIQASINKRYGTVMGPGRGVHLEVTETDLLILKSTKNGEVAEAYLYTQTGSGEIQNLVGSGYLKEGVLIAGKKRTMFTPSDVRIIDDTQLTYKGGWEQARPYYKQAEKILKEFRTLYGRGPHIGDVLNK